LALHSIVLGPYFADDYITADYVTDGTIVTQATFTASGERYATLTTANAVMSSAVTSTTLGGLLIQVSEVYPYTWASQADWDDWYFNRWETTGFGARAVTDITTTGMQILRSSPAFASAFTTVQTGTNMRYGEAAMSSAFTMTTLGGLFAGGQLLASSQFALTATGLRIQEIAGTLFGACTLTTVGSVTYVSNYMDASMAFTLTSPGNMTWRSIPQFAIVSGDLITNNTMRWSGEARESMVWGPFSTAITLAKVDPYRFLVVAPETRYLQVISEPRVIAIPVNTRYSAVTAEPRGLTITQETRKLKLNVPPYKDIVNERIL
jgi:hypothetical protein